MFPLRAIISACVALRIHPNTLHADRRASSTSAAAWALGYGRFMLGVRDHARRQHLRLHRRQGRASACSCSREFGAFWDSTLDRFSDLALLTGLIFLYSKLGRSDYVMIAALTLDLLDHDELRARARRVAGREVQGRLHGAARAHRAAS